MAIKGKSRNRGGARVGGAPKPKIEPRKVPLVRRSWFRWTLLAIVVGGALFGGLTAWGRVSRANALREYADDLERATRDARAYVQGSQDPSLVQVPQDFLAGTRTADDLLTAITNWEPEFGAARDAVLALEPPDELGIANGTISRAMDGFIDVVRFYKQAAELRNTIVDRGIPKLDAKALQKRVEALITEGQEAFSRAEATYQVGNGAVQDLMTAWGVSTEPDVPPIPGDFQIPGQ